MNGNRLHFRFTYSNGIYYLHVERNDKEIIEISATTMEELIDEAKNHLSKESMDEIYKYIDARLNESIRY